MRILIDILHPAHVHFFKHFRTEMLERGHEVLVTAREKDVAVDLLEELEIPHEVLTVQREGTMSLASELLVRTAKVIAAARRFRANVLTGIMGPAIAPAGKLLRTPSVVFYDTEFATRTNRFVYPLASAVCTPDSYEGPVRGTHFTYPGYHELAYLHPNRFTPDEAVLRHFNLEPGERYSVLRFVSWQASHDTGEIALSIAQKLELLETMQEAGRVLISSEAELPAELAPHRLAGPVSLVHHLLAFASTVVGESATMASEAAVLGTPAIYIAKSGRGYINDQEKSYGLARWFQPTAFREALNEIERLHASNKQWAEARQQLLADKVDVTDWMVKYFEDSRFLTP